MSNSPSESHYPHLVFEREDISAERRRRKGFPSPPPDRGGRDHFGPQLMQATDQLLQQQALKRRPEGIQPHLVFRIPLAPNVNNDQIIDLLERADLTTVSVQDDGAIVVFRDQDNLNEFQQAIAAYQAGSAIWRDGQQAKTTQYDIFEFIEVDGVRLWGRTDRIGTHLAQAIGLDASQLNSNERYIVEIEVWHPGTRVAARTLVNEITAFISSLRRESDRFLDSFIGETLALVKVAVSGQTLDELLNVESIAEIDYPLAAAFDRLTVNQATRADFPIPPHPPEDGPRLCIIDSGIVSGHPLLANNVGHAEAILTPEESPYDTNGHGTRVGAIAVFGDVRRCYEQGHFASSITLYSARVLNERNEFDSDKLIVNQLDTAIETFVKAPYECRIFNVSIGGRDSALGAGQRRQSIYSEVLDLLAHKYQVLIVVSAGNNNEFSRLTRAEAEAALTEFPKQLLRPTARLCDFATAAIPLTVGALAQHNSIAEMPGREYFTRLIASANQPSPITRVGPGVQQAIKPEVVHYGGSLVFDPNNPNSIGPNPGASVMSFSHQPLQRLFDFDIGTSYAAPRVAHLAARLEHRLREDLGRRPQPNLIRAIIAASARIPQETIDCFSKVADIRKLVNVCGYGLPDDEAVLQSSDSRVTMIAESTIQLDHFHIYGVPLPEAFRTTRGARTITIALAFDPPVRGRRLDYLGSKMTMALVRGKTLDDVTNACRRLGPNEHIDQVLEQKFQVKLVPSSRPRIGGYSRNKSTLQCAVCTMKRPDKAKATHGDIYWLVVRAERTWMTDEQQNYALAVTLAANTPDLFVQVRQRLQQRVQQRARVRV